MVKSVKHADTIAKAQAGCDRSKVRLIKAYEGFILKIARSHGHKLERDDAMQHGIIGLLDALPRFDLEAGYEFATYARHYVTEHIRLAQRSSSTVRIPSTYNAPLEASRIMRARQQLETRGVDATPAAIAKAAGFAPHAIEEAMKRSLMVSGNAFKPIDDHYDLVDERAGPDASIDLQRMRKVISKASRVLDPREKRILFARVAANDEPETLAALGDEFGVSRERIRQLEVSARKKLNRELRNMGFEDADITLPKPRRRAA